jgi:hypothetical protein
MAELDIKNLEKIVELPSCRGDICAIKHITVVDNNTFILDRRELIREYRKLTGDRSGWFGSLFTGRLKLNGRQIENYQHDYFLNIDHSHGNNKILFDKVYTDID